MGRIYETPKNIEMTRLRKTTHWLLLSYKKGGKSYMGGKHHIRKQLNLNFHICKRYENKMFIDTKTKLASRVLLCDKFPKGENIPFKTVEPQKI